MAGRSSWQTHQVGDLHLTVEAEPLAVVVSGQSTDAHRQRHRRLNDVTQDLASIFDDHGLPATWAVRDPAHSAVTDLLASSGVSHELALAGDRHWVGPTAGRKRFAHELARRVMQARAAGIPLSTLMPRVAPVADHIDLVVKHSIRAIVRVDDVKQGRRERVTSPKLLHYGVWEFAATNRLPGPFDWLPLGRWQLLRSLRYAVARGKTIHFVIDAALAAQQGRTALRAVAAVAQRAAQLRDRGLLRVETLADATARLSDLPSASPQRSILRAAA